MFKKNNFYILLIIFSFFNINNCYLKFNIPNYRDKCFQQDLYVAGALQVRYHLSGFEKDFKGKEQEDLFKNIKIFIKNENGKRMHETNIKERKGKFVVHIKEPGLYYVCARYNKPYRGRELSGEIVMGLKIRNDFYWIDLKNSLHEEDVQHFWTKIRDIKKDMYPSIESAKKEITEEDNTAKSMYSTINTYYTLTIIQLIIIIIFSFLTVCKYKDYFRKKSII